MGDGAAATGTQNCELVAENAFCTRRAPSDNYPERKVPSDQKRHQLSESPSPAIPRPNLWWTHNRAKVWLQHNASHLNGHHATDRMPRFSDKQLEIKAKGRSTHFLEPWNFSQLLSLEWSP